jgi:hypothetical protein
MSTDFDEALLEYAARVLGDLHRRYRLDGLHWPPELESLRLLVASGVRDGQLLMLMRRSAIVLLLRTTPPAGCL